MKKLLISVLLAVSFIATPIFAVEWGGLFRDESGASRKEFTQLSDPSTYTINQSNALYFWLNNAFTEDSSWYLSTEGLYKYKMNLIPGNSPEFVNIVDLDLLKITGQVTSGKTVFNLAAGRFYVFDNTGFIFSQTCDGLSVKFSFPVLDLAFYTGYTGLLNGLTVTMLDETSYATATVGASNQFYSLSHPYAPFILSAEFPTFAGVQTLGIQTSAFLDFNRETKYNRFYADFMMKGPIVGSLFYSFNTTFGFPNFKGVSNYTDITIAGYGGDVLAVYTTIKYASGNNLFFKSFRGVTSSPAYSGVSQPELSGVLIPSVKAIVATSMVDVNFATKCVFVCPAERMSFSGVGFDLGTTVNVFSDLQLSINLESFVDLVAKDSVSEEGEIIRNTGESNYKLTFNLSFAF